MSTEEVRRRIHAATDTIDVPPANPAELLAKAREVRAPRRRRAWVLAAAFAVIVGVAATILVTGERDADMATDPAAQVEADGQALAALAIASLDLAPDAAASGQMEDGVITATIPLRGNSDDNGAPAVVLGVGEDVEEICDNDLAGCQPVASSRGEVTLVWGSDAGSSEGSPEHSVYGVGWFDPETDDFEYAIVRGPGVGGDPREAVVPIAVEDLVGLLTDPRFGRTTTEEMANVELPGWSTEESEIGGESSLSTDEVFVGDVQEMIETHLGLTPEVGDAWSEDEVAAGVGFDLPGEPGAFFEVTVEAIASPDRELPCGEKLFECRRWRVPEGDVTLGWSESGEPSIIVWLLEPDEFQSAMLMDESMRIDRDPRDLDLRISVDQMLALLRDPGLTLADEAS